MNLQRHLAIVHFEDDEIIRRCLDYDSPSGGIAFAFVGMGPVLVAKDRLDPVEVQRRSRPVNQRLEYLLHAMAEMKQQVPAVLPTDRQNTGNERHFVSAHRGRGQNIDRQYKSSVRITGVAALPSGDT